MQRIAGPLQQAVYVAAAAAPRLRALDEEHVMRKIAEHWQYVGLAAA
jgi:hypothetical protein